jgi:acylphosphatase
LSQRRVLARYYGQVQGVGFRATCRQLAGGFKLSGWVKNLPDGSVELLAAGEDEELEAYFAAIRDSRLGSYISREVLEPGPVQGAFKGFEIRP